MKNYMHVITYFLPKKTSSEPYKHLSYDYSDGFNNSVHENLQLWNISRLFQNKAILIKTL